MKRQVHSKQELEGIAQQQDLLRKSHSNDKNSFVLSVYRRPRLPGDTMKKPVFMIHFYEMHDIQKGVFYGRDMKGWRINRLASKVKLLLLAIFLSSPCLCGPLQDKVDELEKEVTALQKETVELQTYVTDNSGLIGVGESTTTATGEIVFPILFSRGLVPLNSLEADLTLPPELDFKELVVGPSAFDGGKEAYYGDGKIIVFADNENVLVNGPIAYVRVTPNAQAVKGQSYPIDLENAVGVDASLRKASSVCLDGTVQVL